MDVRGSDVDRGQKSLSEQMVELWGAAARIRRREGDGEGGKEEANCVHPPPASESDELTAEYADALEKMVNKLRHPSALLRHEVCYALGQTGLPSIAPHLASVLRNESEHAMVRHEAAEALAAINAQDALATLHAFASDPNPEVADTCSVALERLAWQAAQDHVTPHVTVTKEHVTPHVTPHVDAYESIDPAPSAVLDAGTSVERLGALYQDRRRSIFQRYRALFALRNLGGDEAVDVIACGLEDGSALFRHEAAFVLGQMGNARAQAALIRVLQNQTEAGMVRHEAAEALGHLGIEDKETVAILKQYCGDGEEVVAESCQVALDINFYWSKFASGPAACDSDSGCDQFDQAGSNPKEPDLVAPGPAVARA